MKKVCSIIDCNKKHHRNNLCITHYLSTSEYLKACEKRNRLKHKRRKHRKLSKELLDYTKLGRPEYARQYRKLYYEQYPDEVKNSSKSYRKKTKKRQGSYTRKRELAKIQRTPVWADYKAISDFYQNCPAGMVVDHIIPLQSKLVCGLHVEWNLQYLPAKENLSKYNKVINYNL